MYRIVFILACYLVAQTEEAIRYVLGRIHLGNGIQAVPLGIIGVVSIRDLGILPVVCTYPKATNNTNSKSLLR